MSTAQIFKVNQLGDTTVFLPVVGQLLALGRFDRLTVWTTPGVAALYSIFGPTVELETISAKNFYPAWKNPLFLASLIRRARSAHAQAALVAEDMGNTAFLLAFLSSRHRVGHRPPYLKIPGALTDEIDLAPDLPAAEKAWELGRGLAKVFGVASAWPKLPPPPDLRALSVREVESFDVLIHPGASRDYQRWPLQRYRDLAVRLGRDLKVGWFSGDHDQGGTDLPSVTLIPPGDLPNLVSLLARASLLVANNSGPMHLANALGVPSVILAGPSSRCWDPYWYRERCRLLRDESLACISCDPPGLAPLNVCLNRQTPMACMKNWSVDRVEEETRGWLRKWLARDGFGKVPQP